MNLKAALISILFLFTAIPLSADTPSANELVSDMTSEIQSVAKKSTKENYRSNIHEVIDSKYINSIDFRRMAVNATGGLQSFKKATPDQREELIDEYSEFLIGTLSTAIFENSDHTFEVLPTTDEANKKSVDVSVILKDPASGNESEVDFVLHSLEGPWKVYDLKLFGTSTIKSDQVDFKNIIKSDGFDGLIEILKSKNKKNG